MVQNLNLVSFQERHGGKGNSLRILLVSLLISLPAFASDLYTCAKDLSLLHSNVRALGPIFFREEIAFSSINENGRLFIVITPNQIFTAPIDQSVINRVSFRLSGSTYYVSYMHGEITGNRYFEFAKNIIPSGRDKTDFKPLDLKPAPWMSTTLIGMMDDQMDQILSDIRLGAVDKSKAYYFPLNSCQRLPGGGFHAQQLRHNVDVLHVWTKTPIQTSSRMPASL